MLPACDHHRTIRTHPGTNNMAVSNIQGSSTSLGSSSVQAVEYSTPQVYYLGGLFHALIPALVLYRPWNIPRHKFTTLVDCSMLSFQL